MGKTTQTTTTYECDRCHFISEDPFAHRGHAEVKTVVAMMGYDGATGGADWNHWLCGECMEAFRQFLNNMPVPCKATYAAAADLTRVDVSDPEAAHSRADDILLSAVPVEVERAYKRLVERAGWWAAA